MKTRTIKRYLASCGRTITYLNGACPLLEEVDANELDVIECAIQRPDGVYLRKI